MRTSLTPSTVHQLRSKSRTACSCSVRATATACLAGRTNTSTPDGQARCEPGCGNQPESRVPVASIAGMAAADVNAAPDSSAVRTALWRALHVQVDPPPHLIVGEIGLALAAPPDGWQQRGDMHPVGTAPYRTGIVARTRFVEDLLIAEQIGQYVLLGAGLD